MTNNLTNQQKKDWAKLLFMQEGMTFQDIAQYNRRKMGGKRELGDVACRCNFHQGGTDTTSVYADSPDKQGYQRIGY